MRGTAEALARTAVVEDGLANWPMTADDAELVGWDGQIRVQWCHGAPGVVASAYLDEELLLAAAELTWRAGPPRMEKGPGICHGTAGNSYAFLQVFERTGDERWLERARSADIVARQQGVRADRHARVKLARAWIVAELRDHGATLADIGAEMDGRTRPAVLFLERMGRQARARRGRRPSGYF